jgi:hypothetical protein
MATTRWLECTGCRSTLPMDTLFAELSRIATGRLHQCTCGSEVRLRLVFDFALGAGGKECSVIAAFLPQKRKVEWEHNGQPVGFSPFLVITQTADNVQSAWLPYWHQTPGDRRPLKYGQFSPHMDLDLFVDLVEQARAAGYLKPQE